MGASRRKRGSYRKRKPRRYPTRHKTTTQQGKRDYQRQLMRDVLGIPANRYGKHGPRPKVFLVKDFGQYAKKARLIQ